MTLQEVLFKPFVPPPVLRSWKHLADGYEEPEKYRPKGDIAKALNKRLSNHAELNNKIVEFITRNPACTRDQISRALNIKQSCMAERMTALVNRGLVTSESKCLSRRGGARTFFYWVNRRG